MNVDLLGEDIDVSVESSDPQRRYIEPEIVDARQEKNDTSQLQSLGMTPKRLESTCEHTPY